jgi:hypothetical protein
MYTGRHAHGRYVRWQLGRHRLGTKDTRAMRRGTETHGLCGEVLRHGLCGETPLWAAYKVQFYVYSARYDCEPGQFALTSSNRCPTNGEECGLSASANDSPFPTCSFPRLLEQPSHVCLFPFLPFPCSLSLSLSLALPSAILYSLSAPLRQAYAWQDITPRMHRNGAHS